MLNMLEEIVNIDSGSYDKQGVDQFGRYLIERYEGLGFTSQTTQNDTIGNHIILKHPESNQQDILILAHLDTVFKSGTAEERPFRIENNLAFGPGVIDMKASHVMLYYAMLDLINEGALDIIKNLVIFFNSDEEIGSMNSRKTIESLSKDKEYALVLEPARKDGSIVSSRRGTGKFELNVIGKAAHSGLNPENGVNANIELAHKIIEIEKLSKPSEDLHVSVVQIEGGEASNIISPSAQATIDVRISTLEQGLEVEAQLLKIANHPTLEGTEVTINGEITRPPMPHTAEIAETVEMIKSEAEKLDISLHDTFAGGASDASFPAAYGVTTIDGLGPIGGAQHSDDEYLEVDSLFERTQLFIETLKSLSTELKGESQ